MPPPLVFLHGLGTGPSGWAPQLEALAGTRELHAPRLEQAEALLDALEPGFDLCGLSLGALYALRYASDRRERVRRLVVCAGFVRLPPHLRALQLTTAAVARMLPSRLARKGLVSALPQEHRAAALAELGGVTSRELSKTMRKATAFRLEDLPAMPALVLCGERDRANRGLSRRLAEVLPDARFELVPDAGHVANLDNPEAFTELLREFLTTR